MAEISIIIRTKNEERWISHCLSMIQKQDFQDFEVILVDSQSTDHTVEIASRYPLAAVVNIEEYFPGFAINEGIRASKGRFIVCLSSHCVPKETTWLSTLLQNFEEDEKLAGVYGRQLPVSFTNDIDKRDLLIVFGQDRRVQIKDFFFHNANSMLRRDIWDKFPFDEQVTNIEDRVWGKAVVEAGYHIVYEPGAAVYHHHGLHQGNKPQRVKGVVSIIDQVDKDIVNDLPDSLKPENANIVAVVPLGKCFGEMELDRALLDQAIAELKAASFVDSIYLLTPSLDIAGLLFIEAILRDSSLDASNVTVERVLQFALNEIESRGNYPDAILYVNYQYPFRPVNLFNDLIFEAQYKGYDTVFPGFIDYGHFWLQDDNLGFYQINPSMQNRIEREPIFRALYGLGSLTGVSIIRSGKLVGGNAGILAIETFQSTLRLRDTGSSEIIKAFHPDFNIIPT
jgi:rhamnosyltransferase